MEEADNTNLKILQGESGSWCGEDSTSKAHDDKICSDELHRRTSMNLDFFEVCRVYNLKFQIQRTL